nr:MAG TPA: hypothetical protein [Caudoviricetes sp.]
MSHSFFEAFCDFFSSYLMLRNMRGSIELLLLIVGFLISHTTSLLLEGQGSLFTEHKRSLIHIESDFFCFSFL